MNKFNVSFLHTDSSIRNIVIEAFNKERATLRFYINWSADMKLLSVSKL